METLSKLLREAAELQRRVWESYERIFAGLGYDEMPPEHVFDAVAKGVQDAAAALGEDQERIKLFRIREGLKDKRAKIVAEKDECWACGEPLGAPDAEGLRECPECLSVVDESGVERRGTRSITQSEKELNDAIPGSRRGRAGRKKTARK